MVSCGRESLATHSGARAVWRGVDAAASLSPPPGLDLEVGKSRRLPDWAVVPAGMVITTTAFGAFLSFNVFLRSFLDEFGWSRGGTAAAFSLAMVVMGLLSPLSGSLADRHGARPLLSMGAVLMAGAYFLLSGVHETWQLYGLYSLLGIGMAAIYVPVVGEVSRRFRRRGLALGVGVSGITLGSAAIPLSVAGVMSVVGWRGAYVVLAVAVGAIVLGLGQLMGGRRAPITGNPGGGLTLSQAAATATFWKVLLAAGLCLAAVQMVLSHLVAYATDLGLAVTGGASLVSLAGLAGFAGMLVTGTLSDRAGARLPWVLSALLSALALVWLVALRSPAIVYPFVVIFGFAWGGWAVMIPALPAEVFGLRSVAAVLGGLQSGAFLMAASGPAIAGLVFDRTGSYYPAFALGVVLFLSAAALILSARPVREPAAKLAEPSDKEMLSEAGVTTQSLKGGAP